MSTLNIGFYEEMVKILSSNIIKQHLISSSVYVCLIEVNCWEIRNCEL